MDIGCYILFSTKLGKHYIGACQDDLTLRIEKHNTAFYGKKTFTSNAQDWKLILFIKTENFSHAIRLERKIKSMKSTRYIQNLIKYPELQEKIWFETRST